MENLEYNEQLEYNEDIDSYTEISPEEHDELIATLEQFLNVKGGKLVFDEVPSHVYNDFGYDIVDGLIKGVHIANELVDYGEIKINNDFTITLLGEDEPEVFMPIEPRANRNVNRRVRR